MSDEVKDIVEEEVVEQVVDQPAQPQQRQMSLEDMKCGYIVAMTEEGNFVFDLFGKQKGLVEVLGLHKHATSRVDTLYNQAQMSGDALVNEVGKAMAMLNQKMDQILQVIAPKKPDNNL